MKFKYSEVQKMIKNAVKDEREKAQRYFDYERQRAYEFERVEKMEKELYKLERRVKELESCVLRRVENCNKEKQEEVAMTACNVPFPNPGCCTW